MSRVRRYIISGTALFMALLITALTTAVPVFAQTSSSSSSSSEDRVSIDVKDANIRDVLALLFKGRNASFVVDPQVYQVAPAINASITDQPFEVALRSILNANGLKYIKSQNVYTITLKTQPTETTTTPTTPTPETTTETTTRTSVTVAKIPLMRADPAEVAQVFGGTVITGGLIGPGGGYGGYGLSGFGGYGSIGLGGYGLGGFGSYYGGLGGFGGIGYGSWGGIGSWGGYGGLGTGTWGGLGYGGLGGYGSWGTGYGFGTYGYGGVSRP
jgi:hypothetical protein